MKKITPILMLIFIGFSINANVINNKDKQASMLCPPPAQPDTIYGSLHVCINTTATYYITPVVDATSYTWTLPNGWSGTSSTDTITATVGSSNGIISVTANDSCGNSSPAIINVTVDSIPARPGNIYGPFGFCWTGIYVTYYTDPVPGATSYTWFLPGSFSGSSTTDSIIAFEGHTEGQIEVSANNSCGSSAFLYSYVYVNNPPSTPYPLYATSYVCQGGIGYFYSATNLNELNADSYYWTVPADATILSGQYTNSITVLFGTLSQNVTLSCYNNCGYSGIIYSFVNVEPYPPTPTITLAGNALVTDTGNYFIQWNLDSNQILNAYNATYIPITNGTYTVTFSNFYTNEYGNNAICSTTSALFVLNNAGINEINPSNTIEIYPNPASNTITLKDLRFTNYDLRFTDVTGREIYHQPIINQESSIIDISNWCNGVYFYQLINNKETLRGKFVKE